MIKNYKLETGFTLIELILYVALVSMIFATLVPFAWNVINGGVKVGVEQEVYSQARYLSERIKKEIRDASVVTACDLTTLTLANLDGAKNPTTFTFASNQITITQGTVIPSPVRLHSIDTKINSANFCRSYIGTGTDNVQITFTVVSNYTSAVRQEYNESLDVQLSAETRN